MTFNDELYNHLTTIFERAVGTPLDMRQIDRVREESNKLATVITTNVERIAQEKALQVCKLLNDATKAGFKAVSEELELIKAQQNPPVIGA
jgi:hypothetical protein